ncbi:MAG: hypothetical protein M1831_004944 [Alyxoria varia]|nr:MAG: hypothetical protein M1831_004944 [Alyxoria varia]
MSDQTSHHVSDGHRDQTQHEAHNNLFPSDGFGGFDNVLTKGSSAPFVPGWSYQTQNYNDATDPSSSFNVNVNWQDTLPPNQPSSTQNFDFQGHQNAFSGGGEGFSSSLSQFSGLPFNETPELRRFQQDQYTPAINASTHPDTQYLGASNSVYPQSSNQPGTIAPEALQNHAASSKNQQYAVTDSAPASALSNDNIAPRTIPKGIQSRAFLITDLEKLKQTTDSKHFHNFATISDQAIEVPPTKSNVIPQYNPRKSRNELERLLAKNDNLSAKYTKKITTQSGAIGSKSVISQLDSTGKLAPKLPVPGESKSPTDVSSDDASESEYESSEDEESEESPPIPASRPAGAIEAVRFDTIKAVWHVSSRSVAGDEIRNRITQFWEIVSTIRDRWKSDQNDVQKAEESKKVNDLPLLKERVAKQCDMMDAAVKATLQHGHTDIIEHFGASAGLMGLLAQFLTNRVKEADYNGSLPRNILKLLTKCKAMTGQTLDKSALGKVIPRLEKRGDNEVRSLAKRVTDNARVASEKKMKAQRTASQSALRSKESQSAPEPTKKSSPSPQGLKRSRPSEGTSEQPSKKVASGTTGTVKSAQPIKKTDTENNTTKTTTSSTGVKQKVNQVTAKPTGLFSGLESAAKKPGISTTAAASRGKIPANDTNEKKATPNKSNTSSSKSFSFAEAMANIHNPSKSEPELKSEENFLPPETAEQKAKRLRKEARRKLKVTFKPDNALVDIRYFTHDPEEELGHDASQTQDAGDIKSEGHVFKMQHDMGEMMDIDEDEEGGTLPIDNHEKEFTIPSLVDFSLLSFDDRENNYAPHGGGLKQPECPDRALQEQRELDTLMAFYARPEDIPWSPREASGSDADDSTIKKNFGNPQDYVHERIDAAKAEAAKPAPKFPSSPQDIANLLESIKAPALSQPQIQAQPVGAPTASNIQSIVSQLSGSTTQQQQGMPASAPMSQVQTQSGQMPDISAIMSALGQQNLVPQNHALPPPPPQPNNAGLGSQDISSLLASLQPPHGGQQSQPPQQMPPMPGVPPMGQMPPDMSAFMPFMQQQMPQNFSNMMANSMGPQGQQGGNQPLENEERKRFREGQKKKDGKAHEPPKFLYKCKFWEQGKCRKGDKCTYRHDND